MNPHLRRFGSGMLTLGLIVGAVLLIQTYPLFLSGAFCTCLVVALAYAIGCLIDMVIENRAADRLDREIRSRPSAGKSIWDKAVSAIEDL